jgi:peptidoglycan biosynthesis protein MviN/MurJ (putative lipid II flippase)
MSLSSILGVTVQLRKNFYVGPQSQFILNVLFCLELYFAQKYSWSTVTICFLIVSNGIAILLIHLLTFFYYNFYFSIPNKQSISHCLIFFKKFFLALISSLLLESNSFLSLTISSYLKPGLLSLFELLLTLIRVPQQIFGSSLASTINIEIINLIHDQSDELPNRLYPIFKFFLLLSGAALFCVYTFSNIFFNLFFYFANVNHTLIPISSNLLFIMTASLFPALCNKILLNMYYAHEKILLSTFITFFVTICYNIFLFLFISKSQLYAFAIGYFLSDWLRFFILYFILYKKHGFNILSKKKAGAVKKKFLLLLFLLILFLIIEKTLSIFITINFFFKKQILIFISLFFIYLSYIIINKKKK